MVKKIKKRGGRRTALLASVENVPKFGGRHKRRGERKEEDGSNKRLAAVREPNSRPNVFFCNFHFRTTFEDNDLPATVAWKLPFGVLSSLSRRF